MHPRTRCERRFVRHIVREFRRSIMRTWSVLRIDPDAFLKNRMWWAGKQTVGHGNRCSCHDAKTTEKRKRRNALKLFDQEEVDAILNEKRNNMTRVKFLAVLFLLVTVASFGPSAHAQATVFVGYGAARVAAVHDANPITSQSIVGNVTLKVAGPLGLQFEFADANKGAHSELYMGGLNLKLHSGKTVTVFTHGLAGAVRASGITTQIKKGPVTLDNAALALEAGAGIDVALAKHFGLRVAQVDYIRAPLDSLGSKQFVRASAGLTVTF